MPGDWGKSRRSNHSGVTEHPNEVKPEKGDADVSTKREARTVLLTYIRTFHHIVSATLDCAQGGRQFDVERERRPYARKPVQRRLRLSSRRWPPTPLG